MWLPVTYPLPSKLLVISKKGQPGLPFLLGMEEFT